MGDLTFVDNLVDSATGTIRLGPRSPRDHHFWPGQYVNARLVLRVLKGAVLVPAARCRSPPAARSSTW